MLSIFFELSVMDSHCETQSTREISRVNEREDKRVSICIETLAIEIIPLILSKLPISSLVRFKSVCRAWRALAQDPHLADFFSHHSVADNECLIFHTDYPIKSQLHFRDLKAINKEEPKLKKIQTGFFPSTTDFDVVLSCDGLLLLCDSLCNVAYIYNPFTGDYKMLPTLETQYPNQKAVLGFGVCPATKEYKIVKIIYYYHKPEGRARIGLFGPPLYPKSEVQVLTLGSPSWRILGKAPQYLDNSPSRALVSGNLHWLIRPLRYRPRREIISFDLADEQFKEVPKPEVVRFYNSSYLAELNGRLSGVLCLNYGELDIWVMKEYGVKESWVKEFHIGRYVPKALEVELDRRVFDQVSKIASRYRHKYNRVLSVVRSDEILIEKQGRALVLYDPNSGEFKDLVFQDMPKWFETVVHVGSLNEINTVFGL